jgi:hypothetical protein
MSVSLVVYFGILSVWALIGYALIRLVRRAR